MKLDLKLRPTIHVKKKRSPLFLAISWTMALFAVAAIGLVAYVHLSINADLARIQSEVSGIEGRLDKELATVKEVDSFVQHYETLTSDVAVINTIRRTRAFPWIDILNRIEENIGTCKLDNLSIRMQSNAITGRITGTGATVGDVNRFIQRMHAANPYFKLKIDSYQTTLQDGSGILFSLSLKAVDDWYERRAETGRGAQGHGK